MFEAIVSENRTEETLDYNNVSMGELKEHKLHNISEYSPNL